MDDLWDRYARWNDAVVDVVFPELDVPEPVYLDLEDEVMASLGTRMSVAPEAVEAELCKSVADTLQRGGPAAIFERHMHRTRAWVRSGRSSQPPFVALLATFCIAAEQMAAGDGMSSANYFGRLRGVLGWPQGDHRLDQAYRRVAERLWGELNRWLVELDGARGLPTAFALSHRFVGLTVSQALVRSADRDRLRDFFRQYGFAPGAEVAPSELVLLLDSWMSQRPCPASASLERLWKREQARERIAQSAAVALAGWDGSVRSRQGHDGGTGGGPRGSVALTLEMGGFPRKRFALQALFYLPEPARAREAVVETATPAATIDLVPDLPGALGLERGSSLHGGDVLGGVLRIRDTLTQHVLERRPRRLVLFREDELSRRWIESPQVMLGDSIRLLVHEALVPRLTTVLTEIARPGWRVEEPYPGQPGGWAVVTEVEIFNHPGALVKAEGMDDLSPLVPLTSSQLKVAGGFALPGQVRGKWHSWEPPEVRAVSDAAGGFVVRVIDLHRFTENAVEDPAEDVLVEWPDEGTGVVVRSLSELDLADGDYRVELQAIGDQTPMTASTVLLRSADTPDQRQWALLQPISYGEGMGTLGVPVEGAVEVRGHVVSGCGVATLASRGQPPAEPWWRTGRNAVSPIASGLVRLTMPDADSCVYTGRHREWIDTVETDAKGKPLSAWTHGRCRSCGLVRRYPTRLRRSSFDGSHRHTEVPQVAKHDLTDLARMTAETHAWPTAFDAILHTGGGSWSQLERIAFQIEPSALFLDQFARTLEVLGHIDVKRDSRTLEPTAWEVAPTALAATEDGVLLSGYWPSTLYSQLRDALGVAGHRITVDERDDAASSYFAECEPETLGEILTDAEIEGVSVVERSWIDLAAVLPPLSTVLSRLPRQSDALVGDFLWFSPRDNKWIPVDSIHARGAFRARRFGVIDLVRTNDDLHSGRVARSTVQLSKHVAALLDGRPLVSYDCAAQELFVPLGADLPGLYGRAVVASSGTAPVALRAEGLLRYDNVPPELADHVYHLLGS